MVPSADLSLSMNPGSETGGADGDTVGLNGAARGPRFGVGPAVGIWPVSMLGGAAPKPRILRSSAILEIPERSVAPMSASGLGTRMGIGAGGSKASASGVGTRVACGTAGGGGAGPASMDASMASIWSSGMPRRWRMSL